MDDLLVSLMVSQEETLRVFMRTHEQDTVTCEHILRVYAHIYTCRRGSKYNKRSNVNACVHVQPCLRRCACVHVMRTYAHVCIMPIWCGDHAYDCVCVCILLHMEGFDLDMHPLAADQGNNQKRSDDATRNVRTPN